MKVVLPEGALLGELASRLERDVEGVVKAEYCGQFAAAGVTARRRMHEPLTPEEFEITAALAEGAELAGEVVAAVWSEMHR